MNGRFTSAVGNLDLQKILSHIARFASSDMGKDKIQSLQPCSELETISTEHNRVTEVKSILEGGEPFPIDGIRDIRAPLQRAALENSVLTGKELLNIASTMRTAQALKRFVERRSEILPELFRLNASISIHKETEFNITQAIDDNGDVKDSASKELRHVRSEISHKQAMIRRTLEKILRASAEQGMTQDEIVTTRDGRMVIPIKSELKNKFPGFIHSTSASGQTVFIEPSETLTLNNDICELIFLEKREIERILRDLTGQVRIQLPALQEMMHVVTLLDSYFAAAHYSIEIKGNKPFLKHRGSLKLLNGYHPLMLIKHPRETIVPLTIVLGEPARTILITGPNAGGKTVALKSVGLLSLMVQCGLHVPVSADSEFPIFSDMFTLIGDNQSIENDLSTFSSQIEQLKGIVESASDSALVLIDEIGSNTDPTEGGAIAAAILDHLTSIGALTIATSHQASLKAFVHNSAGMENAAMEFDQETLLPTYRLKIGIPGSSYALEIAERLGMPFGVIERSRELLGDQKTRLEQLILDLESRSMDIKNKLHDTEDNLQKYRKLSQEYESKLKQLSQESKEVKKKAIEEARQLVSDASSMIERAISEIRSKQATKDVIKENKSVLAQFDKELHRLELEMTEPQNREQIHRLAFEKDDIVTLRSGGQTGIVVTVPDKKGNLVVAFNSIKAKVNVGNISKIVKKSDSIRSLSSTVTIEKAASLEIDVRGFYSDEAIPMVDKFLDDAVLSGLQRVDIIHGKGTGALRKSIQTFLQKDDRVKSMRLGELNEGGAGVTVVDLTP